MPDRPLAVAADSAQEVEEDHLIFDEFFERQAGPMGSFFASFVHGG
jgi:hypothetical protein